MLTKQQLLEMDKITGLNKSGQNVQPEAAPQDDILAQLAGEGQQTPPQEDVLSQLSGGVEPEPTDIPKALNLDDEQKQKWAKLTPQEKQEVVNKINSSMGGIGVPGLDIVAGGIKGAFEGAKQGVDTLMKGGGAEGFAGAITGVGQEGESLSTEERIMRAGKGLLSIPESVLQTVGGAVGGVAEKLPFGKEVTGAISSGIGTVAQGGSDLFKGILKQSGVELNEEQHKLIDQGFNDLTNLVLMKHGEDASKFSALEKSKANALKAGDMTKYEELVKQKPTIGQNISGNIQKGMGDLTKPVTDFAVKKAKGVLPSVENTVKGRIKDLSELAKKPGPVRTAITNAEGRGIDVKKMISESDLLQGSVNKDGIIDSTVARATHDEAMQPLEGKVRQVVEKENKSVPVSEVAKMFQKGVDESGIKGRAKATAKRLADKEIEGLKLDAVDAEGNPWKEGISEGEPHIKVVDLHDAKVYKGGAINYDKPNVHAADKVITHQLKTLVEDNTKSLDVQKYNRALSEQYAIRDLIDALNGKIVKGGRLGGYFAKALGSAVGGALGTLGQTPWSVAGGISAGAKIGDIISGQLMKRKFGRATGAPVISSDILTNVLKNQEDLGKQSTTASPNNTQPKNAIIKSKGTPVIPSKALKGKVIPPQKKKSY